jgi:general stress protein YciG
LFYSNVSNSSNILQEKGETLMRICNYCGSEIDDKTLYASSPPKYKCPKCWFIPILQTRIVKEDKPDMSCKEAGRRGGIKTSLRHGEDFYRKIGRKGGLRTQQLLQAGKEQEQVEKAIADYDAGLTTSIEDFAAKYNINIDE